jgi:hypothetical protein
MALKEYTTGVIGRTFDVSQPPWPRPLPAKPGAPTVLFIVQDDTGFGQLGCYGSPIKTPSLDALAANGLLTAPWSRPASRGNAPVSDNPINPNDVSVPPASGLQRLQRLIDLRALEPDTFFKIMVGPSGSKPKAVSEDRRKDRGEDRSPASPAPMTKAPLPKPVHGG